MIRILKESESVKELMKKMKDEFAFDPTFPSLVPFDVNTGNEQTPAAKLMDPHTVNTVLYRFAMDYDLSKMISLFETAISYPTASMYKPYNDSQALPFFSSSSEFASNSTPEATRPEAKEAPTTAQVSDVRPEDELVSKPLDLSSVNTQSFELLIEQAVSSGRIYLAHHYLKLCVTAWKQERRRLRAAYEPLLNWNGESTDQTALVRLKDKVRATRVSISVYAFYPIYMQLKHSKNGKMRYAPVLKSCLHLAEECLGYLKDDTLFFARAYDQLTKLEAALTPESAKQLAQRRRMQTLGEYAKEIDLRTHTLLQTRLQIELGELARFIEVASIDVLINRQLDSLLYKLSVARPMPNVDDDYLGYTILIDRLEDGIKHAENWLALDVQQDERRVALLRSTLDLSAMQMQAKIEQKRFKYARKRAIVSEAIVTAQVAVQEAKAARREILDAREALANAERRETSPASLEKSEQRDSSFGSNTGELQFLNVSGKRQTGEVVQAALYGSGSSLVLC